MLEMSSYHCYQLARSDSYISMLSVVSAVLCDDV